MPKTARQRDPSTNTIPSKHRRAPLFMSKAERAMFDRLTASPNGLAPKDTTEYNIMYRLSLIDLVEFKRRSRDVDYRCCLTKRGHALVSVGDELKDLESRASSERRDHESLHGDEDGMRQRALESIAAHSTDPWAADVAKTALRTSQLKFARDCA